MARPKQRRQTLLFSRKAVICQRDGQLCLMFRVGDMRKSHIIGTNITAHIFRTRTTREGRSPTLIYFYIKTLKAYMTLICNLSGEELPQYQCELSVSADGCDSNLFFIWPLTMVHVIDKKSPLYSISAQELLHETFEIVAILEGTVESTGQTTQARYSKISSISSSEAHVNIVIFSGLRICPARLNGAIDSNPFCLTMRSVKAMK